jgi:hypothetical protein
MMNDLHEKMRNGGSIRDNFPNPAAVDAFIRGLLIEIENHEARAETEKRVFSAKVELFRTELFNSMYEIQKRHDLK